MSEAFSFIQDQLRLLSKEPEEAWKHDHKKAMWSYSVQERVAALNYVFERFILVDDRWRSAVHRGECEYSPDVESTFADAFKEWKNAASTWINFADELEREGWTVNGAELLRSRQEEVAAMLTPDDKFFTGAKLATLRDDAIDANRSGGTTTFGRMGD
jgi:hypothetical protein